MDFKLDTTHDLEITNYDLVLNSADESVKQRLLVRLLTFRGEWFLDTDFGVPYYQTIFQKGITKDVVDTVIKREIEADVGVKNIKTFTSTMNNASREYTCSFVVITTEGDTVEVTL